MRYEGVDGDARQTTPEEVAAFRAEMALQRKGADAGTKAVAAAASRMARDASSLPGSRTSISSPGDLHAQIQDLQKHLKVCRLEYPPIIPV